MDNMSQNGPKMVLFPFFENSGTQVFGQNALSQLDCRIRLSGLSQESREGYVFAYR